MGVLLSCCRPSAAETDVITPDAEARRRQVAAAAERRLREMESKGVKDPERVKRLEKRASEMEKREKELSRDGGPTLKWSAN